MSILRLALLSLLFLCVAGSLAYPWDYQPEAAPAFAVFRGWEPA